MEYDGYKGASQSLLHVMVRRTIGLGIVLLLSFNLTTFAEDTQPTLSLKVIDSQAVDYGNYSITYERVETPILKPQPTAKPALPPAPIVQPSAAELEYIRKMEAKKQVYPFLGGTVFGGKITVLRFWLDGGEYVYRSNINFNYLRSMTELETEQSYYMLFMSIGDEENLPSEYLNIAKNDLSQSDAASRYVLISQPKTDIKPEAEQLMRDIHAYYDSHKVELIRTYQENEKKQIEHEKWVKEHPPQPQSSVIRFFPIRSNMDSLLKAQTK